MCADLPLNVNVDVTMLMYPLGTTHECQMTGGSVQDILSIDQVRLARLQNGLFSLAHTLPDVNPFSHKSVILLF